MVRGVARIASEDICQQCIQARIALNLNTLTLVLPVLKHQHRFDLDIIGIVLRDLFQVANIVLQSLFALVAYLIGNVSSFLLARNILRAV